jgi:DNA mismatch repair protein MSH3
LIPDTWHVNAVAWCPQEQQVVALKAAHPGVLLLVEVGYKMRMFGADAEVAAKVRPLMCLQRVGTLIALGIQQSTVS